jgi:hypothetical protein
VRWSRYTCAKSGLDCTKPFGRDGDIPLRRSAAKTFAAVAVALADGVVRQRFADLGMELFPREQQTPEALGTFHKAEVEKWWPIIKAANIKGE